MREPVRILSDLHLGHHVSRIENVSALRPLIAGAGTVIFNGDTWQGLPSPLRENSAKLLDELLALCAEQGVDAIFLSGNHDPDWEGPGWVELADGKIIITHGDTLLFDGSPWKREILLAGKRVIEIWGEHPGAEWDVEQRIHLARKIARELASSDYPTGKHLIQRAWDAILPPRRAFKMLEAWFTQAIVGARFCDHYFPKAEALIIGHFHREGCWLHRGRLIINTGSFLNPSRAHWAEWNHGFLTRGVIEENPEQCNIGEILDTWRF